MNHRRRTRDEHEHDVDARCAERDGFWVRRRINFRRELAKDDHDDREQEAGDRHGPDVAVRCATIVAVADANTLAAARMTRLAPSQSSGFNSSRSSTFAVALSRLRLGAGCDSG